MSREKTRYLSLCICHGPPLCGGEDALLGGFGLVTEDIVDEPWIRPNVLEEHEVSTEGLLRSVWILDIALARLASLALGSTVGVLAFNVVRGERAHVSVEFSLASFLCGLGAALIRLEEKG